MGESKEASGGERGDTRRRILDSAMRLIEEKGLGGLRIRELARLSGIRESSVYNHFEGKEAIVRELFRVVDAGMSPLGSILDLESSSPAELESLRALIAEGGFRAFLDASVEHLIAHFAANPSSFRLIRQAMAERFHDPNAHEVYEGVIRRDFTRALRTICTVAAEAGALSLDLDPQALAELAVACFEHALGEAAPKGGLEAFSSDLRALLGTLGRLSQRH